MRSDGSAAESRGKVRCRSDGCLDLGVGGLMATPDFVHKASQKAMLTPASRDDALHAELTRLYWTMGKRLRTEVLGDARASYGTKIIDQLGQQLAQEFGRGFEPRNLRRMVKFAEGFPDAAIVSTLSTKLSWSHMLAIKVCPEKYQEPS